MIRSILAGVCVLFVAIPVLADEPVDLQMISRIKSEGLENSKVMETLSDLVDTHGPRLAGSPNFRAAAEWCRGKFEKWGLENAHLESWGKIGRGWVIKRYRIEMIEPYYLNIIGCPKAWTSSTDGVISAEPMLIKVDSADDLEKYEGKLKGAIVMVSDPPALETSFEADAKRYTDESLTDVYKSSTAGRRRPPAETPGRRSDFRGRRALREKMNGTLSKEGVGCIIEASRGAHGTLFVQGSGSREVKDDPAPPSLVIAAEHYGLIARLLKKKVPVKLEVSVETSFTDDEIEDFNVVAEIPGSDPMLKDELVMLGGHLDSWHSATGTTDNAAGCAVAMETVRILKSIGARPRRTVRVALWGGEEEGLLGSRGYVKSHFGDRDTMELTPAHALLSGYFNLDNGTGRIRGIYCQSNDAVRPIFEAWLKPFHDMDATMVTSRNTGGTDHQSFDGLGLPGFQFIQDSIDYDTRTHHTNMDTYERAIGEDLKQASVIMSSFVYNTAMRDEKLPRKVLPEARKRAEEPDSPASTPEREKSPEPAATGA